MTGPDPSSWFRGQVREEIAELELIDEAIGREHSLGATTVCVRDSFTLLLRDRVRDLRDLERLTAPDWPRLASLRSGRDQEVKDAALGLLQGIMLRRHPLYRDVALAAERLLDDLVDASGIGQDVLLSIGGSERFERLAGLVRMRFPDVGVWGLPILVHELGHMVADALPASDDRNRRPVLEHLDQEAYLVGGDRRQAYRHLNELFADVFATYALGVAYPLAVMTLRAAPDALDDVTPTHPSWTRRVWTMVSCLRATADRIPGRLAAASYRRDADRLLEPYWTSITTSPPPGDEAGRTVARQANGLIGLLDRHAPPRLRHDPARNVDALAGDLAAGVPAAAAPVDVLSAAWRWRATHPGADRGTLARVSATALRVITAPTG